MRSARRSRILCCARATTSACASRRCGRGRPRPAPSAPEPAEENDDEEEDEAEQPPPAPPGAPGPARPPWALLALVAVGAGAMATVIALFPHATARPIESPAAYDVDASSAAPPGARPPGAASSPEARPTHRGRGRGVVRLGSSTDDVLRAFGPPDRLETGPGPGDAVLHYGTLRLEMKNGRVAGGDAAAR